MNTEYYVINHQNKPIEFKLVRKKVKNINLRITPEMDVIVSADKKIPAETVCHFVASKGDWIDTHLEQLMLRKENSKDIDEKKQNLYYLGNKYQYRFIKSSKIKSKITEDCIFFYTNNIKTNHQLYIDRWYKENALNIIYDSLGRVYPLIKKYKIQKPLVRNRKMKRRWGTCYPDKKMIILNTCLIMYPRECIDYVVLHELCHFIHYYHNQKFYSLMDELMPDWRSRKELLNR
jgi:hypothetical protein